MVLVVVVVVDGMSVVRPRKRHRIFQSVEFGREERTNPEIRSKIIFPILNW